MARWLITDHVHELIPTELKALGKQVDHHPDISNDEVAEIIHRYEGLIISSKTFIDRALIDRAKTLKIVGRVGSGMEHVDRAYCDQRGIVCLNSPEGNANAVGEHAFGMLLSLANNLRTAHTELVQGTWKREENRGFELKGKTIGVIGYGHTGQAFASKFTGWGCRILVYDKYLSGFGNSLIEESTLADLQQQADVISFHVPYTTDTHYYLDEAFIKACKTSVIFINTSRGKVASARALLDALRSDLIGGLCLDVFEQEPVFQDNELDPIYKEIFDDKRVAASPHIAGWSTESRYLLASILMEKIKTHLNT